MACAGCCPQVAAYFVPINVWQHDIQHNQVRHNRTCFFQRIFTTLGNINLVALTTEVNPKHIRNIRVIFNNEKAGIIHKKPRVWCPGNI